MYYYFVIKTTRVVVSLSSRKIKRYKIIIIIDKREKYMSGRRAQKHVKHESIIMQQNIVGR